VQGRFGLADPSVSVLHSSVVQGSRLKEERRGFQLLKALSLEIGGRNRRSASVIWAGGAEGRIRGTSARAPLIGRGAEDA
jgi:hypothetical protein